MHKLEGVSRGDLIKIAMWLSGRNSVELFDPYTDEQLRQYIASRSIENTFRAMRLSGSTVKFPA